MSVEDVYLVISKILSMLNISILRYSITLCRKVEGYSSVPPAFRPGVLSHPLEMNAAQISLSEVINGLAQYFLSGSISTVA
jgi:hypothetical protein